MSLLPALTMIRLRAIALLPLSYYLLTSPATITDHNLVFMLGEAMALPHAHSHAPSPTYLTTQTGPTPTAVTALVALLLALASITDLSAFAALPSDDEGGDGKSGGGGQILHYYWRSIVPVRLLFFFAVTGGSYLGAEGAMGMLKGEGRPSSGGRGSGSGVSGAGAGIGGGGGDGWREACCNSLVFTWGFLEMVFWFWMFVTLREEGKVRAGKEAVRRKEREEDDMEGSKEGL